MKNLFILLFMGAFFTFNCSAQDSKPSKPAAPVAALPTTQTTPAAPAACACCTDAHSAFDFWLGDWEAFSPTGQLAGTNHIVKMQGECILQENWVSAKGAFTGTSYNHYDATTKQWRQLWIDNQGGNLLLTGQKSGDQMILQSDKVANPKGEMIINRITWTDNKDGTVRQLWEVSKDDQKTWNTVFDGLYKKAKR